MIIVSQDSLDRILLFFFFFLPSSILRSKPFYFCSFFFNHYYPVYLCFLFLFAVSFVEVWIGVLRIPKRNV